MKKLLFCALVIIGMLTLDKPELSASDLPTTKAEDDGVFTLEEIQANPESFKATRIIFRAQFHKFNDLYSPFYTIFNSTSHLNFSAWEFDTPLWQKDAFKRDFPYLYVDKKDRALCEQLLDLPEFARFEAVGEIRSTFSNVPWIQITTLKVIPLSLSMESVRHIARGYHQKKKGNDLNAVLEFTQAYEKNLPREVKQLIRKEEGQALFNLGKYEEAVSALEMASRLGGSEMKDEEVEHLLKEAIAMQAYEEMLADEMEEWEEDTEEMKTCEVEADEEMGELPSSDEEWVEENEDEPMEKIADQEEEVTEEDDDG